MLMPQVNISSSWLVALTIGAGATTLLTGCQSAAPQSPDAANLLADENDGLVLGKTYTLSAEEVAFYRWALTERAQSFPAEKPLLIFPRSFVAERESSSSWDYRRIFAATVKELPPNFIPMAGWEDFMRSDQFADRAAYAGHLSDARLLDRLQKRLDTIKNWRKQLPQHEPNSALENWENEEPISNIPYVWFNQGGVDYIDRGPKISFRYRERLGIIALPGRTAAFTYIDKLKFITLHEFAHHLDRQENNLDYSELDAEVYAVVRYMQKIGQASGTDGTAWQTGLKKSRIYAANRLWEEFNYPTAPQTTQPTYDAGGLMMEILANDAAQVKSALGLSPEHLLQQLVQPFVRARALSRQEQIEIALEMQAIKTAHPEAIKSTMAEVLDVATSNRLDFYPMLDMGSAAHWVQVFADNNISMPPLARESAQLLQSTAVILDIPQTSAEQAALVAAAKKSINDLVASKTIASLRSIDDRQR